MRPFPAGIYFLAPSPLRQWRRPDVFNANFEDILHLVLVFLLLTLNMYLSAGFISTFPDISVKCVNFEICS